MKKAYKEIEEILKGIDSPENRPLNMTYHISKLAEEVGELATGVNRFNGRKNRNKITDNEIIDNITEEAADSIQCIMAIAINAGVDYETLKKSLHQKNKKFAKAIKE